MRSLFLAFLLFFVCNCFSQSGVHMVISGIIVDFDSIPIPDVAIVNTRSNKTVRTNSIGYFQTEIVSEDSLLIYHIAYKKRFVNKNNNGRCIVLEPETQELMQVDITNKNEQEMKNLGETINDIKRLANMKKLEGFDLKSRQDYFYDQNGSHNNGFMQFFGPTFHIPFGKIIGLIGGNEEKRLKKKLTSHYHLVKKKK